MISRFHLGAPRKAGEGLRVAVMARPPRGVPSDRYRVDNYFDVRLQVLAPSRDLLATRKTIDEDTVSNWHRFFRRYEAEMRQSTEARQAIALLAGLARRTHISLGCSCSRNHYCHVPVLMDLVAEAAGRRDGNIDSKVRVCRPSPRPLTDQVLYTITEADKVGKGTREKEMMVPSGRSWTRARDLLHGGMLRKQHVPVLIGDAADVSRILAIGLVWDVSVGDSGTELSLHYVRRYEKRRDELSLILDDGGKRLSRSYRRSYAILRRPAFMRPHLFGRHLK